MTTTRTDPDALRTLLQLGEKMLADKAEAEAKRAQEEEIERRQLWHSLAAVVAEDTSGACLLPESPPKGFTHHTDKWLVRWSPFGGAWCQRVYTDLRGSDVRWAALGDNRYWRVPARYDPETDPDLISPEDEATLVCPRAERLSESVAEAVALVARAEPSYSEAIHEARQWCRPDATDPMHD